MSQRGTAPHSTSRRSTQSPPRDVVSSSPSQRGLAHQDDSHERPPHDPGGTPVAEGEGRNQRRGSRTSGVHNILNPPGPRRPQPGSSPAVEPTGQAKMGTGQYGGDGSPGRPLGYQGLQGQGAATPQQANPAIPMTQSPTGLQLSGSPPGVHPYPLAAATRRILTPKSPRAASLSRAAMRTMEAQQRHSNLPPHSTRSAAPAHDSSPLSGPPTLGGLSQFPGPIQGQGQGPMASGPTRPTSGLSRSLSQPVMSHGLPPTTSQEPLPASSLGHDRGGRAVYSPSQPFATPLPPNRGSAAEGRWGSGVVGPLPPSVSGGARNLQLGVGQQHLLAITPTHGEELLIPVDYHQASKQADEKRQRNAGASARFRQRKKEREKEQQQGLQKLESRNRELEKKNEELEHRNQELEAERDFYRRERNRLRELVAQTPGISEWAERAPSSPTPSRSGATFTADHSPLMASAPLSHSHSRPYSSHSHALAHPHPPPSSYGDPSMLERPARRRRTDSEPQLGAPSYRPSTPASLPPIAGPPPAYSIPPSPHMSASPGPARLPPIRLDQPLPTSETPPPIQSGPPPAPGPQQGGQGSTYTSYKASYETGWATGPRGPAEGGPR